uniref:DUF3754 domain-containing protein n=1 Tax=uncultured marine group II/III euryarchaeote KM3_18_D06 TaxID=1457956 RepID=A0A075GVZ4_9EURY|nr:hypothetical protein [uncultured marine group II/III euryarchaeote KM3_18_D06]
MDGQLSVEGDSRQQYIPVSRAKVKEAVFQLEGIGSETREGLLKVSNMLEAIWHHSTHQGLEKLKSLYELMDPDQDGVPETAGRREFLSKIDSNLVDGNWEEVSDEEMREALEGEDVFPISLNVRFDEFVTMKLYKLGEVTVEDERSSMFGLRKEAVTIEAFDRIIQILEFHDKSWFEEQKRMKHYQGDEGRGLHIRLFKTVPKLDLETIFPNTSPMMRGVDKIKIGAPLIGGLVTVAMKFGPILIGASAGSTSLSLIGGICAALGTYVMKTWMSYQKTREKYQTQVSKDLYFKGQANNAAVLNMIVDLGEEQEVKEALLAYTFLLVEQDKGYNEERLDERIEEWLLDTFNRDIDFEVDDALRKLKEMKLLHSMEDGTLSVTSVEKSLSILDEYWDNIYDY